MVRDASGYSGLTSHRYGQAPEDDERNLDAYSVTRLEFEKAKRLGLPTVIFVMGADHPTSDRETGFRCLSRGIYNTWRCSSVSRYNSAWEQASV